MPSTFILICILVISNGYFTHQNIQLPKDLNIEWNLCMAHVSRANRVRNCVDLFKFTEKVCVKLNQSEKIKVVTDRASGAFVASMIKYMNDGLESDQQKQQWSVIAAVLNVRQLKWHIHKVSHGAVKGLFDLLALWKRQKVAILVDESSDILPESFENTMQKAQIKGGSYLINSKLLKDKLVDISRKWPHIVVFADFTTVSEVVAQAKNYSLFSNEINSWLFVSTNQSLQTLANIQEPLAQINMLIDEHNSLKDTFVNFSTAIVTLHGQKQQIPSIPIACLELLENIVKNSTIKPRIMFKLVDKFAYRMSTCSELELYDLFYSRKTDQTEILNIGRWSSTSGLKFHVRSEDINPEGGLKGRLIRITTLEDPPYIFIPNLNNITSISGYIKDIMHTIIHKLDFSPEIEVAPTHLFGSEVSPGNYDGLVGLLYRREADIGMAVFGMTVKRTPAIRYTAPVIKGDLSIFIRRPPQGASYTAYFETFEWKVWIMVGIIILLAIIALLTVIYVNKYKIIAKPWSYFDHRKSPLQKIMKNKKDKLYWVISGMFYEEVTRYSPPGSATKIVFGVFLISTLVISAYYTSTLTSFLINQQIKMPFTTMDELVYSHPEYKIILVYGTNHYDRFRTSRFGVFKDVWLQFLNEEDPNKMVFDLQTGVDLAYTGKYAFFSDGHSTKHLIQQNCSLTYLEAKYFREFYFFPTRHDFPYNKLITITLRKIHEHGLMAFLRRKYLPFLEIPTCPLRQKSISLSLTQVVTVYFIFICGLMLFALFTLLTLNFSIINCYQLLSDGFYPFEEGPDLTPPVVRKPPYTQTNAVCHGALAPLQSNMEPPIYHTLCGDLNNGFLPKNPMGQQPLGESYPFDLIRNKTLEYLSEILPLLREDHTVPKVAKFKEPAVGEGLPRGMAKRSVSFTNLDFLKNKPQLSTSSQLSAEARTAPVTGRGFCDGRDGFNRNENPIIESTVSGNDIHSIPITTPCPSKAKYATPLFAKNYQGLWRYVVQIPFEGYLTQTVEVTRCLQGQCNFLEGHCLASPRWVSLLVAEIFYPNAFFPTTPSNNVKRASQLASPPAPPVADFENFQQYLVKRASAPSQTVKKAEDKVDESSEEHCDGFDAIGCFQIRLFYDWFLIPGACKCWKPPGKSIFLQRSNINQ
ncbi:hypothetical protein CHUAL_013612 [Chamberlinius hualienensis]